MKEEILSNKEVKEILDKMDNIFDSHNFIVEFMRKYPKPYTQGLCKYNRASSNDPIRIFHAEIGKFLGKQSNLKPLDKDSTLNVRGSSSENEKWQKI